MWISAETLCGQRYCGSITKAIAVVAEDEPVVRMIASDMLADAGFDVVEAGNAAEAIRGLELAPDVALLMTDVQMPGSMNGFGLAREVARRWPHVAIVVCSARVWPVEGELPPKARFINKPYGDALIRQTLREMNLI